MTDPLLKVDDLVVSFGKPDKRVPVVRGVSLTVGRGETLAVVGESGSGKTVTSLAVLGLVGKRKKTESVSGRIEFVNSNGTSIDLTKIDRSSMRHIQGNEIAMIFQESMSSLNPVLRIGEQITEALIEHQGESRGSAQRIAIDLLGRVGIPDPERRMRSYPHELSGGMRQRVMIAMALSCRPALLIADEPTTALDVTIQAQILDLIAEMKSDAGSSVLFITHDLGVVREIANRVVVMYAGVVVEEGSVEDVISAPRHPYTRGLIGCVPRVVIGEAERPPLEPIPGLVADPARPPAGCVFHPRCPHFVSGLCDADEPPLEEIGPGRKVRCLRWQEIEGAAS